MAEKWESDSVEKHLRKTKQNGIQLSFLIFVLFFKNEISLKTAYPFVTVTIYGN